MCFCHDYFALISYFLFGVLHTAGTTKTPKRRLICTLSAQLMRLPASLAIQCEAQSKTHTRFTRHKS